MDHFDLAIVDPPYGGLDTIFDTSKVVANKTTKHAQKPWNNAVPDAAYWAELFRVSKHVIAWGGNWYGRFFGVGGVCWFKDNSGNYSPCEYAYQSINNHIHHLEYRWNGMLQANMKEKEVRIHPTQKPVALYRWLLERFAKPGDRILDTHLGSGSIAIACHYRGHPLTACEIDADYYAAAVERIQRETRQLSLFTDNDADQATASGKRR
jgi:site-specific DNA-methyltransferase (adenine-specific)